MKRIKVKFAALFLLLFIFATPLFAAQPSAKSNGNAAVSKKSATKTSTKKSAAQKKSTKKKHRGRAAYISSHETEEQKRLIAEETKRLELDPDYSGDNPELAPDKLVWPVKYGYISRGVRKGHRGIDMMACANDPVYAVADGVVEFISIGSRDYRGYGKLVVIRHEDKNLWSCYSHCSAIYLYEGQEVKRGQRIAAVGRTGRTTSNHLHFELRGENKKVLNPLDYLPEEGALGRSYVPH